MIKFQYYSNSINSSSPIGWINLDRFIQVTKNPKDCIKDIYVKIAGCEASGDMISKAKLKEGLYSFTPCVNVSNSRKYSDITAFTGLLVLDFDHISNASDFKEYLFQEYWSVIAAWLSPSKKGVKALVKIPVVNSPDEFKSYFYGIANEMWQYNGFDGSGQNCVLPLFQSWDNDILVRDDYSTWVTKGKKLRDFDQSISSHNPVESNDQFVKRIIKMIDTAIDHINSNGHPQLRSICLAVGGYAANNYIDLNTAEREIFYKIETNSYLKKGIPGYKKTAQWSLKIGMTKPLSL